MKPMNIAKYAPRINAAKAVAATALASIGMSVNAAVPQDVKDALMGAKADGLEAGWIVVAVVAGLFVIKIVKSLLR